MGRQTGKLFGWLAGLREALASCRTGGKMITAKQQMWGCCSCSLVVCDLSVFTLLWSVSIHFSVIRQYSLVVCDLSVFCLWSVSILLSVICQYSLVCDLSVFCLWSVSIFLSVIYQCSVCDLSVFSCRLWSVSILLSVICQCGLAFASSAEHTLGEASVMFCFDGWLWW